MIDRRHSMPRSASLLAVGCVAAAGLSLFLGADLVPTVWRVGLAVCLVVLAGTWFWWLRAGTAAAARTAMVLFLLAAPVASVLSISQNGMPLLILAVCLAVVEVGLGFGWGVAGCYLIAAVLVFLRIAPSGGVVLNAGFLATVLALGVLLGAVIRRLDDARRAAEQVADERRRHALAEFDRALAQDRMRQARALHDDLGQQLTVIGMGLELAERLRASDQAAAWAEVGQTKTQAAAALTSLRRQVRALSPAASAEPQHVDAALEQLGETFRGTGLQVEVDRRGAGTADALAYRIIQESLTNVARHADAERVLVTIDAPTQTGQITVQVDDDGAGGAATEGFGLQHLRQRVEAAGGEFRAGASGGGFRVLATYPREAA